MAKTLARAPIPLAALVAASVIGTATATPASAAEPAAIVAGLTETVALPAVDGFADAAGSFEARVGEACAEPSKPDRAALEAAYADLAHAHARVEILGFGPYTRDNLGFKLAFWPDKHNVAARQVRQYLREADPKAVTAEALAKGSVAVQGLPAVARVLHGDAPDPFACAFLLGLAGNIDRLAGTLKAGWEEGYARDLRGGDGNDGLIVYYRAAADGIDRVRDLKLERPLGASIGAAAGGLAEGALGNRSTANIAANLDTIEALLVGNSGLGLADALPEAEAERLRGALDGHFVIARDYLDDLGLPLALAVGDEDARSKVEVARFALQDVDRTMKASLGPALGFTAGFNASDGD